MIAIFGKIFLRGGSLRFSKRLKQEIAGMKHELEEHLQAINENTNEITASYEYISEIENKIDKLSARIEQIQMHLECGSSDAPKSDNFDVKRLNRREQEVFLVIYTLEDEKNGVTYDDIACKLSMSVQLAANYVTALIEKGIPMQIKENILQLSLQEFGF